MGNACWRRCCAEHDECFHNGGDPPHPGNPCTSSSWGCGGRPECDTCNEDVMDCFFRNIICWWGPPTPRDYYGRRCGTVDTYGYGRNRSRDSRGQCVN